MIVTLGEAMWVFNGPGERPVLVGNSFDATFAGAEANVAVGLARLGHEVRWLSVVGEDAFGREIVRRLRGEGVDVSGVQVSKERGTGVMVKGWRAGGEPEVFYYRGASAFAAARPATFDPGLWRDAKVVFLTGITPALSGSCRELFGHVVANARAHGVRVWLDPNYRGKLWGREAFAAALAGVLPEVDTILPGMEAGEMLTGKREPGEIACALMGMGVKNVVVKAGERGAFAYTERGNAAAGPVEIERVVDPIGAGDGFAAGYLSAEVEGLGLEECLRRGHAVAGMVCLTRGDWEGLPTRGELERFVAGHRGAGR
jgi:2-dehydro-3-deoxygluconokinase